MAQSRPRVALVFPTPIHTDSYFGYVLPALGLERLAAAIEDLAEVELFDGRFERDLVAAVVAMRPDVIAVSVKTTMYCRLSYDVARQLRERLPGAKIVLGGLHATSCPEEAIEYGDFVVRGEGEEAFRKLIQGTDPGSIPGLVFRGPDGLVLNPMAAPIADLDALKPPARHLRKPHYRYAAAGLIPMDLLETSRGCTHACSFCSPASVYPHKWRTFSPSYVVAEIRTLAARGVKMVMLTDDHFGGNPEHVEQICDGIIESGIRMAFFCFIRPFTGRMDLKRKMVQAGFVGVTYGAESPSTEQLQRYGKGYPTGNAEFLRQVNTEWREAGARYVGNSYVFGDVSDSKETLEALGAYARSLDPTYIEPIYALPYPNTRYRRELLELDLVVPRDWSMYTETRMLVRHPELDEEALRRLRARTWVDFYTPRKAIPSTLMFLLYLHQHLGISRWKVLRYMAACDYAIFGCFLEDKTYEDLHEEMVLDYFRRALATFEPEELDMTDHMDAFVDMLGLGLLKRLAGKLELVFEVVEDARVLASVCYRIAEGRIASACVEVGKSPRTPGLRRVALPLSLRPLARFMAARKPSAKLAALVGILRGARR